MRVQIQGVSIYAEDQVFILIDSNLAYSRHVPVILGTPTINRVSMVMRESEMTIAPPEWQYSRRSYEFANGIFMGMVSAGTEEGATACATNTAVNPSNLDEKGETTREIHRPCIQYTCPPRTDGTYDDAGLSPTSYHASSLPR